MNPQIADMCGQGLRLEETHISWVLLGEKEVWKIKKPVVFDFLDYRTPEKRRQACDAGAKFTYIECRADPETSRTRLLNRNGKSDVSDAREKLLDDFLRQWEPVVELIPAIEHRVVDTTLPFDQAWKELKGRLD